MGEKFEELKQHLCEIFPKLAEDEHFEITSDPTPNYNCIAWACIYKDRWMQPTFLGRPNLDCVVWWPPEVEECLEPDCLKKVFEKHGYIECSTSQNEEGYRKVALYYREDINEWTHASRELRNGLWTSKLGQSYDIQHGTPETIENNSYGKVYCIMKLKLD